MKLNGTIFSKPQQDQLKRGIGAELGKVAAKVDDVDKRMLNYMGDWATGNEYHENDVVTWGTDGHLYEIIKAHTSSATFDPDNPEYYKAMTARKLSSHKFTSANDTYAYIMSIGFSKIKYITIKDGNNGLWNLLPQGEANFYSTSKLLTTDGGVRDVYIYITTTYASAYYIDTTKTGERTLTAISNIQEYTVYVEE